MATINLVAVMHIVIRPTISDTKIISYDKSIPSLSVSNEKMKSKYNKKVAHVTQTSIKENEHTVMSSKCLIKPSFPK